MSRLLAAPAKIPLKSKRLRTKRERDAAKFGPRLPMGGSRRGPRWLLPRPWGGLALGSPLRPPKRVVITENRLCLRGLFNHKVESLEVRRPLSPSGGSPLPAPRIEEGEPAGVPGEPLKELVAGLASLLVGFGAFVGRELVSERRRGLVAALRRHRRGPPDLGVFLAHRTPAQPPGQGAAQGEARPGPPGPALIFGGWDAGDTPAGTPSPLGVVDTLPRAPSPIFGALGEWKNPFSWSSAEDETPGGLPPPPPPFWGSPQPPQGEEEEEMGGDAGWTPIAPPVFSPDPPPGRAPRTPRPPRAPKVWRTETPWDPPGPSRSPWDPPRPPWGSPDPPRAPPRPSQVPQLWSREPRKAPPVPPRPPWDPPNPSRPSWDPPNPPRSPWDAPRFPWDPPNPPRPPWDPPRSPWDPSPWSPELPRPPQTPQLWDPEPPRPPWDPPRPRRDPAGVPGPLWDSPDPTWPPPDPAGSPRTPPLWSPEPPWDPRPWSPEPPGVPQDAEPPRCCCRRLCRDTAQRRPLRRDLLCHRHPACRDTLRRDPAHRDPLHRDPAHRDPLHRDPPCPDSFHRDPPRPAALCRHPRCRCRDPARCCPQPPKRHRPGWGGVGGRPPSPPAPPGCGCFCWGGWSG